MFISIFNLVVLINYASILTMGQTVTFSKQTSLTRRQINLGGAKNVTTSKMNMGGMGMSESEKEAREEAAEKLPGLNTIANAYKELYYQDKYGSQRGDTSALVRMTGQATGTIASSGDPEAVAKAVLLVFESYNAQGPPSSPNRNATKAMPMSERPSLNTIAHSLHEVWEKMVESSGPKPDTAMVVKTVGQAIATSSSSGDPSTVAKAIESASAKFMPA